MDLVFTVKAQWAGVNKEGEGEMQIGDHRFLYSAPANMGGKGVGSSPEDLLLAAVTACYSGTLMRVLSQSHLPGKSVAIQTDGIVEGFPENAKFAHITVHPTIKGGDVRRQDEYETAAEVARDRCFIGRTVRDYLHYAVGRVTVE
jgi:peroxiredoxin-like protein